MKSQSELEKIVSGVEKRVEHSLMLRMLDKRIISRLAEKFGFKPEEVAVFIEPELPRGQYRPDIVVVAGDVIFVIEVKVTSRVRLSAVDKLLAAKEAIKDMFKAEKVIPILAVYAKRPVVTDRILLKRLERLGIELLQV